MKNSDVLLVTDLQNDFCPGGALAVAGGDEIVDPINGLMEFFPFIVATYDWHPANHCSFKEQGGPWPVHCLQNTWGAELHPRLDQSRIGLRICKARFQDRDAYSAFKETELDRELKKKGVRRLFLTGLTTEYCIKETSLDALRNGFEVVIFTDLVRAVNLREGDGDRALEAIRQAGALLALSPDAVL